MTHHKPMRWKVRRQPDGMWAIFRPSDGAWVCSNETWAKAMYVASGDRNRDLDARWFRFERTGHFR